jgi:hypothetical protein
MPVTHANFARKLLASRQWAVGSALAAAMAAGCSGRPGAVDVVDIDPTDASRALIAEHDKSGDGALSEDELAMLGAIRSRMNKYDADGDGKISKLELEDGLKRVFDGRTGLLSASCRVTQNGRPLVGAYVYFVPIALLKDLVPVASGVTESGGLANLSIQKDDLPKNAPPVSGLIRPGLYAIEVTHPSLKIPEIYNVKTTLGQEVTQETCSGGPLQIALKF